MPPVFHHYAKYLILLKRDFGVIRKSEILVNHTLFEACVNLCHLHGKSGPGHPRPYPGGVPGPTGGLFEDLCHVLVPSSPMGQHYQSTAWFYTLAGHIYPLSHAETEAMEAYVQEALAQGLIRPSTSPSASSFFFVKKKEGGLHPCIDYRILNKATVKFSYPLPLIPTVIEQVLSTLLKWIHAVPTTWCTSDRGTNGRKGGLKIAFSTGHYEYRVKPYSLTNAPSVFQSFINKVFRDVGSLCSDVRRQHLDVFHYTRAACLSLMPGPSWRG